MTISKILPLKPCRSKEWLHFFASRNCEVNRHRFFAMQKFRAKWLGRICHFLASFLIDNFAMQKNVSMISALTVIYEWQN